MTKFASILAAAGLLVALPAVAQTANAPRNTTTGQAPGAPAMSDSTSTTDRAAQPAPLANTQGATGTQTSTTTNRAAAGSTGTSAPALSDDNTTSKSASTSKAPLANTQGATGSSSSSTDSSMTATDDSAAAKKTTKKSTKHKHSSQSSSADDHMADQLNAKVLAGDFQPGSSAMGSSGSSQPEE